MTKMEYALSLLKDYHKHAVGKQEADALQLAIDTLIVRRVIAWICEACGDALSCSYIRFDPSPYPVACYDCHTAYEVKPATNDYDMSEVNRVC